MRRRLTEEAALLVARRVGTPSVAMATQTPRLQTGTNNKSKQREPNKHTHTLHPAGMEKELGARKYKKK